LLCDKNTENCGAIHDDWKRDLVVYQIQVFLVELHQVGNRQRRRTSWIMTINLKCRVFERRETYQAC